MRHGKIIEITDADMAVVREVDAVKDDGDVEIHRRRPKRVVVVIVKRPALYQVVR